MNKNESQKSTTKKMLTWLKVSTPFYWKITHVWSSQILFEKHTNKEYVHVKHDGKLLLSWSLFYVCQIYAMHIPQWISDLTFVSNVNFKSRYCWLVCFVNELTCLEIEKYFINCLNKIYGNQKSNMVCVK